MSDAVRGRIFRKNVLKFFSGEWVLDYRANGGGAVMARTFWTTGWLYSIALVLYSVTADGAVMRFSPEQLRLDIGKTLPWLGAIFAASYVALYARFSAQWNYLAGLYNQQMQACLSLSEEKLNSKTMWNWKAAFVEDAYELHLATKPMFAVAVKQMLQNEQVRKAFIESVHKGAAIVNIMERQLGIALKVQRAEAVLDAERLTRLVGVQSAKGAIQPLSDWADPGKH